MVVHYRIFKKSRKNGRVYRLALACGTVYKKSRPSGGYSGFTAAHEKCKRCLNSKIYQDRRNQVK